MSAIGSKLRPDIGDVRERWAAFWLGESARPLVWGECVREGEGYNERIRELSVPYPQRPSDDFGRFARNLLELRTTCYDYVGDAVPSVDASFGPDQISGFLGQKIEFSDDSRGTNWSVPMEKELEEIIPLIQVDESNSMYSAMLDYHTQLAEVLDGRAVINGLDYHSNFDAIASMRDPALACIDLMEKPELMKEALRRVTEAYKTFVDRFYEAGGMADVGTCCWVPAYSTGRYITLNSDFICMLSPRQVDEFVIPCLEEECSVIDHAIFHLDGPDAMKHARSIASVGKIRAIQWTPGSGNPQNGPYWLDFYRDVLLMGTGLWICGVDVETAKLLHTELKSNKIIYRPDGTKAEIEAFVRWLETH